RDRGPEQMALEDSELGRPEAGEIADLDRPGGEVDLVQRANQRRAIARPLLHLEGGLRELGKALRKILGRRVDMIRGSVVEQVPDDLDSGLAGGIERGKPARPVIFARRLLDQMPAKAVAHRAEAELLALPIILRDVAVVPGRADQVEANAVAPPMRHAFEPGLGETCA